MVYIRYSCDLNERIQRIFEQNKKAEKGKTNNYNCEQSPNDSMTKRKQRHRTNYIGITSNAYLGKPNMNTVVVQGYNV